MASTASITKISARATGGRPLPAGAPRVSVVVPTLNEARNLPHAFHNLPTDLHEVILVDGRSTDDTVAVARALRPDVKVVRELAKGKGAALRAGFDAATGDIIVMFDADGSADGAEIDTYVQALLDGADFAKGSRFMAGAGSADITPMRRAGNWVLCKIVNGWFGSDYSDLCYGYNAFWQHCLPVIDVDCAGFEVETLINIRLAESPMLVVEVPSFEYDRLHGESNLHVVRDGLRVLRTILREGLGRMRRRPQPQHVAEPVQLAVPVPSAEHDSIAA